MPEQPVLCHNTSCPPFQNVVSLLSSNKHTSLVDEYCSIAREDPSYLTYHCMSIALRVQYELKLEDVPGLTIGGCMSQFPEPCCLVEALKEVIQQRSMYRIEKSITPAAGIDKRS